MPKKAAKKTVKYASTKSFKKVAKKVKKAAKGGNRTGAGRPVGTGKFGCATKAVRVPAHLVDEIQAYALKRAKAKK